MSAEVEMTAYGLLTYTLLGDVASALPVVKWLSQQRNALGGFSSTQVALLCSASLVFCSVAASFHDQIKLNKVILCLFSSRSFVKVIS